MAADLSSLRAQLDSLRAYSDQDQHIDFQSLRRKIDPRVVDRIAGLDGQRGVTVREAVQFLEDALSAASSGSSAEFLHKYNFAQSAAAESAVAVAFTVAALATRDSVAQAPPAGVLDWAKTKSDREDAKQFPAFKAGEQVRVSGIVERDPKSGGYQLRAEAGDGRWADNFFVPRPADPDPLASLVGMPATFVVTVGAKRNEKFILDDISNYNASFTKLVSTPPKNPTPEDVDKLPTGKRVVIEGEFLGFVGKETDNRDKAAAAKIKTPDGRLVIVQLPFGQIEFSGGVYENLSRKMPGPGDRVSVAALVDRDPQQSRGAATLAASSNDPCILRQAAPAREHAYEHLRKDVEKNVGKLAELIQSGRFAEARKLIGKTRHEELTGAEVDDIDALVAKIPENERPVMVPKDRYVGTAAPDDEIRDIEGAYGVVIEQMSKQEFLDFMRAAVTGERKQTGQHADTSDLFAIAEDLGVAASDRETLLRASIDARLARVRGVPHNERDFDDVFNLEQAFKYLAGVGTASGAQYVIDLLSDMASKKEFDAIGWRDGDRSKKPESFIFALSEALSEAIDDIPPGVLAQNRVKLQAVARTLRVEADEPVAEDELARLLGPDASVIKSSSEDRPNDEPEISAADLAKGVGLIDTGNFLQVFWNWILELLGTADVVWHEDDWKIAGERLAADPRLGPEFRRRFRLALAANDNDTEAARRMLTRDLADAIQRNNIEQKTGATRKECVAAAIYVVSGILGTTPSEFAPQAQVLAARDKIAEWVRAAKNDPTAPEMLKHVLLVHSYGGHVGVTYDTNGADFGQLDLADYLQARLAKEFVGMAVSALVLGPNLGDAPNDATKLQQAKDELTKLMKTPDKLAPADRDMVKRVLAVQGGDNAFFGTGGPCLWAIYDGNDAGFSQDELTGRLQALLHERGIDVAVSTFPIFQNDIVSTM